MNLLTDYLQVRSGGGIILLPNNILGGCPWERWLHRSLRPTLATQDAAKRKEHRVSVPAQGFASS